MVKIIYVAELPRGLIIKTETSLLVGTQKGDVELERLCSQEGQ